MSILLIDTDNAYLAITDLLSEEKRALLARTLSGPLAIPHLEAIAERLAVITRKGIPYAAELGEADRRHDIGAAVLDLICRIHELMGSLPEHAEHADAAHKVRGTLSMDRAIISASYGEEAANALRNRKLVAEIDGVLREMPAVRGVSARDVAELFIGGGEKIGVLLARRADAVAEARAARAESSSANLLHEARALLQRVRSTLDGEVALRDDLPADLVDRIFSVLDERIAVAAARQGRGRAGANGAPIDGEGADGTVAPAIDLDDGAGIDSAEAPTAEAEAPADAPARGPLRPLPGND